jgi:hypothetical protein
LSAGNLVLNCSDSHPVWWSFSTVTVNVLWHFACSSRSEVTGCVVLVTQSHAKLLQGIVDLAARVQADAGLTNLIRRKFSIKCTTGYSLNALVDFPLDDPIEILKRLMIGSEGTLGFVSRVTINTVPEWPNKVSSFCLTLYFGAKVVMFFVKVGLHK